MHCDSSSVLHVVANKMTHDIVKHIDISYHFITQVASTKEVKRVYIDDELNHVDLLTNIIPEVYFVKHYKAIQVLALDN